MSIPKEVKERIELLEEICRQYPVDIPLEVAAKYTGNDKDCLRQSIDQGKCRFGYGWTSGPRNIRHNKIPMLAFYAFASGGVDVSNFK